MLDQIRFANTGRTDQNHILIGVFGLLGAPGIFLFEATQVIGMVVMIAHGDREHFLRFLLFDDEAVQMRLDIARQKIEFEFLIVDLLRFFILRRSRWFRLGKRRHGDSIAEVLFHELGDLGLQFFR